MNLARTVRRTFLGIALAFVLTQAAVAGSIVYTLTGTATGTFGGTPFTNAAFTVTSFGNTSQVFQPAASEFEDIATSSSVKIAGFATATFTDSIFWEDLNGAGILNLGDVTLGQAILGFTDSAPQDGLGTFNLQSSFGPLSDPTGFDAPSFFGNFQNIPTSGGSLSLVASNDIFSAVASPEPSAFLLGFLGLIGIAARCLRPAIST